MPPGRRRTPEPQTEEDITELQKRLVALQRQLQRSQASLAQDLQELLNQLAGSTFPSHDVAVTTTRMVQDFMRQLGRRAKCPNTGEPCNLRCTQAGRGKVSTFQFECFLHGKRTVTSAFTVFPEIELIEPRPGRGSPSHHS